MSMMSVRKVSHEEGCENYGTRTSVEFELEYDNSRIESKQNESIVRRRKRSELLKAQDSSNTFR